jgi:hypothetical protein
MHTLPYFSSFFFLGCRLCIFSTATLIGFFNIVLWNKMFSHIEFFLFAGKALPTCESSVILNRTRLPGFRSNFFHALFTLHVLGYYPSDLNNRAYSMQ